ncbi:MAG: signal peptidase I [Actinobacteria bacterium]|nr:signal peptidase I [Actinomycetota bacterium]
MTPEDTPFDRYTLPPIKGPTDVPAESPEDPADSVGPPPLPPVTSAFEEEVAFFEEAELQVASVDEVEPAEAHEPEPDEDDEPEVVNETEEAAYFAVGYDEPPPLRRPRALSPLADAANVVDALETLAAASPASAPPVSLAPNDAEADAVVFATAAHTLHEDEDNDDLDDDVAAALGRPPLPPPVPVSDEPEALDEETLPDFLRADALEAAFGVKFTESEHFAALEPEPHLTAVVAEEPPMGLKDRPKPTVARTLAEIPILLIVAALIAFLVKTFLAQAYYIPSGSMLPQLQIDDRVVVSKLAYKVHDPNRGDIVVFDDPRPRAESTAADQRTGFQKWVRKVGEGIGVVQPSTDEFIKRVIGLPGDRVSGHDGSVYINGKRLLEAYLPEGVETTDFPAQTVAPGRLWVMGDNRSGSADSRAFGQIKVDSIVGRAVVKVWPFDHISFL